MPVTANSEPVNLPLPKVLRTKITPPQTSARTLHRARVTQTLLEAVTFRLTILQAGAGYGKSTALAALAEEYQPLIWYQVTDEDHDPLLFLLHLFHATARSLPEIGDIPIEYLSTWDSSHGPLPTTELLDQYINALATGLEIPTLLVIDDAHLALDSNENAILLDRLVSYAPDPLHILLAGRPAISLHGLPRWRSQGDVLSLDQSTLAFTAPEIATLFAAHYGYELTADEVDHLLENTEGWAIALQLIWQNLRSGSSATVDAALARPATSQQALFDILAREVFEHQPEDVQAFLLGSATLREMTSQACEALITAEDGSMALARNIGATALLAYLRRQEMFVVESGDGVLRYHHIFHSFLQQQADPRQRQIWHR